MDGGVIKHEHQQIELVRDLRKRAERLQQATQKTPSCLSQTRHTFCVKGLVLAVQRIQWLSSTSPTRCQNTADSFNTHLLPQRLHSDRPWQGRSEHVIVAPPRPWEVDARQCWRQVRHDMLQVACMGANESGKGRVFGSFCGLGRRTRKYGGQSLLVWSHRTQLPAERSQEHQPTHNGSLRHPRHTSAPGLRPAVWCSAMPLAKSPPPKERQRHLNSTCISQSVGDDSAWENITLGTRMSCDAI